MKLCTNDARLFRSATFQRHRVLVGSVGALAVAVAVAFGATPATAKAKADPQSRHGQAGRTSKEPFGDVPKGPIQIFISIDQQKLFLYSDGVALAEADVATGVPGHDTPMGVFSVIAKNRFHRSNIYSNAPMPYMQRITWSGVALHEGVGVGHRASHGCIRMPHEFAVRLWDFTRLGARVIIARNELRPVAFADAHLFVHKAAPQPPSAAAAAVKTAQTAVGSTSTDAAIAPPPAMPVNDKPARVPTVAAAAADGAAARVSNAAADLPPDAGNRVPAANAATDNDVQRRGSATGSTTPAVAAEAGSPQPKPAAAAEAPHGPIAIFISRKTSRIYVRQHFEPLFDAPITIDQPEKPFGTHVFTAMDYLDDGSSFRWNVVSLSANPSKPVRKPQTERGGERHASGWRREVPAEAADPSSAPEDALARIEIPQDVADRISQLIVPGSSLVVSDQGLGKETGEGTDFIVVTR